jgi:hypothetical protein
MTYEEDALQMKISVAYIDLQNKMQELLNDWLKVWRGQFLPN